MATTLADIRTAVSVRLGLTTGTGDDQTELDRLAHEGIREILVRTGAYVTTQSFTPGASQDYSLASLSTATLEIKNIEVTSGTNTWSLEPTSREEIRRMRRVSAAVSQPPRHYALAGHDTLMFYPTPGASDSVSIYHVPLPTEMTVSTHDAFTVSGTNYGRLPIVAFPVLLDYVSWRMADYDDDSTSQMGERYHDLYEQGIARLRQFLRDRAGYRLAPARLRRRRYRPYDNSQDI